MAKHQLIVYLDSLRAGHSYIEMVDPDTEENSVYGFYPEKFDEKKEVLVDIGSLKADRERLESSRASEQVNLIEKHYDLDESEYDRACAYLENERSNPSWYFLVGYNCIDFIQDLLVATRDDEIDHFANDFTDAELEELSWVGTYAKAHKLLNRVVV